MWRSGKSAVTTRPNHLFAFATPLPPAETGRFAQLVRAVRAAGGGAGEGGGGVWRPNRDPESAPRVTSPRRLHSRPSPKVDTDAETQLASQLQIQGLPTLVFIPAAMDKPALRTEGLMSAADIKSIIEKELGVTCG